MEKGNLTTFSLIEELAKHLNVKVEQVSASGLKDEQAITKQIISVNRVLSDKDVTEANLYFSEIDGFRILVKHILDYGNEAVLPRRLHGNEFRITVRNLDYRSADSLESLLKLDRYFSFINYYDEQRFGTPDSVHNTHLIGKNILEGNWKEAHVEYVKSGNGQEEGNLVKSALDSGLSHKDAMLKIMPQKLNFFMSSWNSDKWNKSLSEVISKNEGAKLVGLPYIGSLYYTLTNESLVTALHKIEVTKRDIESDEVVTEIKSRPSIISTAVYLVGRDKDEIFEGKEAVTLSFFLPTGCYATMMIKQLLIKALNN